MPAKPNIIANHLLSLPSSIGYCPLNASHCVEYQQIQFDTPFLLEYQYHQSHNIEYTKMIQFPRALLYMLRCMLLFIVSCQ